LIPSRIELYGFSKDYALSRYGIVHGIALPFVLIPWMVIECFASLILPEYSRYFAQNNTEKITNITNYIFENTFYISIFISFFIYIISDDICMAIYSNSEVSYYVKILCPLIPIMYIDTIVDNMLRGLDLQLKVMQVNILDVVISIILIYFGVPYLGTFGYILVIYAGEYLNGVLSIEILLKNINVKFKYFKWLLFPIVVGFIFLYLTSYISNSTIIQSILFTILYLLYYLFQKKDKV
jgi:stage V sporulation protein B